MPLEAFLPSNPLRVQDTIAGETLGRLAQNVPLGGEPALTRLGLGHSSLRLPHPLVRINGRHHLPRRAARLRSRGGDATAFAVSFNELP